jgi:hypothetical protein
MPNKNSVDEQEVCDFVHMIGLPFTVLAIDPQRSNSRPVARTCAHADEVVAFIRSRNPDGQNIYWLPNEASVQDKKPARDDIAFAHFAWADCDPDIKKHGSYEAARRHLLTQHAPMLESAGASFVIDSGNGLQPFFRLAKPMSLAHGRERYETLNARLGEALDGPSTGNCDRIMRLPGTWNWPNAAKLKKGYPATPSMSRVLYESNANFIPFEIETIVRSKLGVPRAVPVKAAAAKSSVVSPRSSSDEHARFDQLLKTDLRLRSRWEGSTDFLQDTSGSGMDMSLYAMLIARDFAHDAIVEIMLDWEHGSRDERRELTDPDSYYWNRLKRTKAKPPAQTPLGIAVAELNEQYAHCMSGGSAFIIDERESPPVFMKEEAFRSKLRNRYVDAQTLNGMRPMPLADQWLKHADRRSFERVEFAPGGAREGSYNLFRGMAVEPYPDMTLEEAAKGCSLLLAHIKDNVCQGNAEHYDYLLGWFAHMFQKPDEKPGVAAVLGGEKGTGKTKVTESISALLGPHAFMVSQARHVTGNFNAHLAQTLLLGVEEAIWAGDKAAESTLKHLITSQTIPMERKGIDAIEIASFMRIIMTSNAAWKVPASPDERRFFVLECGDARQNDHAYFRAIDNQLYGEGKRKHRPGQDSPGLRALLTYLLKLDISAFEVRKVPETDALKQQRAASFDSVEEFLHLLFEDQSLVDGDDWPEEETPLLKKLLHERYRRFAEKQRVRYSVSASQFGTTVTKSTGWLPTQRRLDGRVRPVWMVPIYPEALRMFEDRMKIRIERATRDWTQ